MDLYIEKNNYNNIIEHCVRKLSGDFYDDETKEKQAFGIIVGKKYNFGFKITKVVNLKYNYRFSKEVSEKMNNYIEKYAIPGGMDISERAWAIDPLELNNVLVELKNDELFLGTYHMHSELSWKGDFPKKLPTELDRKLNVGSGLINLIVYISENEKSIKAFFESDINDEYNFVIIKEDIVNEDKI